MNEKVRTALGLLLSAAVVAYIMRNVDLQLVWSAIVQSNKALLVLAAVVVTFCFPLRAIRWRVMLQPTDPELKLGLAWRATAVGFALNNVLPYRLGEVARAYSLSREAPRVGFPAAFASLALDRVFDAVVLIALFVVGLIGIPSSGGSEGLTRITGWVSATAVLAGGLMVALVALAFFPSRIIRLYEFFARKISPALEARGSALLSSFASGLGALRSPARFLLIVFWTLAHWLLNAFAFWIGFRAFGIDASYFAALFTQTTIGFAIAIPQGPSGIGTFQWAGALALGLYGVQEPQAYGWGFGYWAFSFVPITTIGMIYFARMGLSINELKRLVAEIKGAESADNVGTKPT